VKKRQEKRAGALGRLVDRLQRLESGDKKVLDTAKRFRNQRPDEKSGNSYKEFLVSSVAGLKEKVRS